MSDTLDTDNIEASYGDGVLHLTVPIVRAAEPRRVQVKTRGDGERQIDVEAEPAQTDSAD